MSVDDLLNEFIDYYGDYKKSKQKEITRFFITKRYRQEDFHILMKFTYESHPVNYGPPVVSNFKNIEASARAEATTFKRPNIERGMAMYRCPKCKKKMRITETHCPYCQQPMHGINELILPRGYFDE